MTNKILQGAKEAVAVARGEQPAARIIVNGHAYVPATALDSLTARVKELEAEREKLNLHIQTFVESVQYHDSYGVPGSEFMACLCCRGGGAPGVPLVHENHCPVGKSLDTYQDWYDEQREFERESRENAARALRAEQQRDEAYERLKPFAEAEQDIGEGAPDDWDIWESPAAINIKVGHLRAARDLIRRLASGPEGGVKP